MQRSSVQLGLICLLSGLLLAVNLACYQSVEFVAAQAVLALTTLLCAALALRGWYKSPNGILCWTGSRWVWEGFLHNAPVRVECALEWHGGALLRLSTPEGALAWLWIDAGMATRRFRALRRARIHRERPVRALASVR